MDSQPLPATPAVAPASTVRQRLGAWARALRLDTLKVRLAAGSLLAMLAGIGAAVWYLTDLAHQEWLLVARSHEQVEASRTAAIIGRRIGEVQRALRVTAEHIDPDLLRTKERLAHDLESRPVLRAMFSSIGLIDPDGRVVVSVSDTGTQFPGISVGDRSYFRRTVQERRGMVSDPIPSRLTTEPVVVFTHPIIDRQGEVAGVLAGTITLTAQDLLQDIVDERDDDRDTLIVVADGSGRIIAHPMRARVMQLIDNEPRLAHAVGRWINDGRPLVRDAGAWSDEGNVVAMAAEGITAWHVWRTTSAQSLGAPLRQARERATWVVRGLALALSALLVLYLARQLRPLAQLESRAAGLMQGDQASPWPQATGEIGRVVETLRHVWTERARAEALNAIVLARLSSVMAAAPVGLAFTRHRSYELVSAELCRMLGRTEASLIGQSGSAIFASHDDYQAIGPQVAAAFAAGEVYHGDWRLLRADGSRFWARLQARPVSPGDPAAGTIWSIHDITEQVEDRDRLQHAATHDALTGVLNRKGFEQALAEAMSADAPASVLVMIDLDRFKPINDSAGHAAGDAVLRAVAAAMTQQVRASDVVARLGGDEFALLLRGCNESRAVAIADKVRQAVGSAEVDWQGRRLSVGASLGVCARHAELADAAAWLAQADAACYAAKRAGRAAVHVATAAQVTVPALLH